MWPKNTKRKKSAVSRGLAAKRLEWVLSLREEEVARCEEVLQFARIARSMDADRSDLSEAYAVELGFFEEDLERSRKRAQVIARMVTVANAPDASLHLAEALEFDGIVSSAKSGTTGDGTANGGER